MTKFTLYPSTGSSFPNSNALVDDRPVLSSVPPSSPSSQTPPPPPPPSSSLPPPSPPHSALSSGNPASRACSACHDLLLATSANELRLHRLARAHLFLATSAPSSRVRASSSGAAAAAAPQPRGTFLPPFFTVGVEHPTAAFSRLLDFAVSGLLNLPALLVGPASRLLLLSYQSLRLYGLTGLYGLVLREEFVAAADLLARVVGDCGEGWPMGVAEVTATLFYSLAEFRRRRGDDPEGEHRMHAIRDKKQGRRATDKHAAPLQEDDAKAAVNSVREEETLFFIQSILEAYDVATADSAAEHEEEGGEEAAIRQALNQYAAELSESKSEPAEKAAAPLEGGTSQTQPKRVTLTKGAGEVLHNAKYIYKGFVEGGSSSSDRSPILPKTPLPMGGASAIAATSQFSAPAPLEPCCLPVSDSLLSSILHYAPLALTFAYSPCPVELQLLSAHLGYRLLYASKLDPALSAIEVDRPAYAVLASEARKSVVIIVRGTQTLNDVVTDIRAEPVPFPSTEISGSSEERRSGGGGGGDDGGSALDDEDAEAGWETVCARCPASEGSPTTRPLSLALCGMAASAQNLFSENVSVIDAFVDAGYDVRCTGHSLGGGVASLLGLLIRDHLITRGVLKPLDKSGGGDECDDVSSEDDESPCPKYPPLVRVYSYGTPSCVNLSLARRTTDLCVSVVLHDDIVPRLSPTSIRDLVKHLLIIRRTWVEDHLASDLEALGRRFRGAWTPRWRDSFTVKSLGGGQGSDRVADNVAHDNALEKVDEVSEASGDEREEEAKGADDSAAASTTSPSVSSIPSRSGVVDAVHSTVEGWGLWKSSAAKETELPPASSEAPPTSEELDNLDAKEDKDSSFEESAVLLAEAPPLPSMYIPGQIAHIYSHRGRYKMAIVPRTFSDLNQISLSEDLINDHTCRGYYEALLEVRSVRRAKHEPPKWAPYSSSSVCSNCSSEFTWASTSHSQAQEARDKHNCKACGLLVCEPCSRQRITLPDYGISAPVRVCDGCYYELGFRSVGETEPAMTRSFNADRGNSAPSSDKKDGASNNDNTADLSAVRGRSESSRRRGSSVVEELVKNMKSL